MLRVFSITELLHLFKQIKDSKLVPEKYLSVPGIRLFLQYTFLIYWNLQVRERINYLNCLKIFQSFETINFTSAEIQCVIS